MDFEGRGESLLPSGYGRLGRKREGKVHEYLYAVVHGYDSV